MYFKELAHMIVGVGRSKICKMLHLESKSGLKEAKIPLHICFFSGNVTDQLTKTRLSGWV